MTFQKHHIKRLNFFLTRLTIFLFLISAFYLMPETLIISLRAFGFNPDFIKNHLKEFAIILAKIIISSGAKLFPGDTIINLAHIEKLSGPIPYWMTNNFLCDSIKLFHSPDEEPTMLNHIINLSQFANGPELQARVQILCTIEVNNILILIFRISFIRII